MGDKVAILCRFLGNRVQNSKRLSGEWEKVQVPLSHFHKLTERMKGFNLIEHLPKVIEQLNLKKNWMNAEKINIMISSLEASKWSNKF
jgi:CRISPR/Cas system-associated endoribonuclease Cas2